MSAGINLGLVLSAVWLLLGLSAPLHAMDRWSALSQIESGDDDLAVGAAGELSRYQIRPELWQQYAPAGTEWTNATNALAVAKRIMQERCSAFERITHRPPTDAEFYILWNAPAQCGRPGKAVISRADRFHNLVNAR